MLGRRTPGIRIVLVIVNSTSARMKTIRHVSSGNRCPMKRAVDPKPARREIPKSKSAAFLNKLQGISTSRPPDAIVISIRRTGQRPTERSIVDDVPHARHCRNWYAEGISAQYGRKDDD